MLIAARWGASWLALTNSSPFLVELWNIKGRDAFKAMKRIVRSICGYLASVGVVLDLLQIVVET